VVPFPLLLVDQDSVGFFIFKLEEETPALLLPLPKLFAETPVFGSASGLSCRLVVGIAQASSVLG
jgi:hypothetical protein